VGLPHQDALDEDLVRRGVGLEEVHHLGGELGQVKRVRVGRFGLWSHGDGRGDELGDLGAGAIQLRAQRLGVGVDGALRGGVGGRDREGEGTRCPS
jgi:hypothetical protein